MKKSPCYFSFSLALVLILAIIPPVFGAASKDASGHWASAQIDRWKSHGIVNGYEDGSFRPDEKITRAEYVTVVNKLFGYTANGDDNFSNVSANAWFAGEMAIAKAAGYYKGFPSNLGQPEASINRQDAAALLARAFVLNTGTAPSSASMFKDESLISSYAKDAIRTLAEDHIISGYADGTFRPQQAVTRAELVTFIDKLIAAYYSAEGEYIGGPIASHAVINKTGVTLKQSTLSRNLYLALGIHNGDTHLNEVQVKGTTFIWGSGDNTITAANAELADVQIERIDGRLRLIAAGTTTISNLTVNSPATIELSGSATIDHLIVNHASAIIISKGSKIKKLTIHSDGADTSITGEGNIEQVDVQANGVTLNGQPLAIGTAKIIGGSTASPTPKPGAATGASGSSNGGGNSGSHSETHPGGGEQLPVIDLVDAKATASTRSLFAYLQDIRGKHILFGHQHPTDEVLSMTAPGEPKAETYSAVGDYPAMFGWDTLSLEGYEKPGSLSNTPVQNRDNLVASMKEAYEIGGVLALSAHMPNFVTGGDFYDTSGNAVSHILPGGDKHEDYNAFLDQIADFAHHLKDDKGSLIPVIFRPFHEQNGGWFWWGAPYTTKEQYIEIYRYTVEYLRDEKGVRNFLYAFSPGSPFNNTEAAFLKTYPGDDYVDILGFDTYYDGTNQGWFDTVIDDAKLISRIADARGKVAAFTEFGYSNVKPTGTADLQFYTKLIAALQSDPDAKRMAYMLTWANFNYDSIFVPYRNSAQYGDHELLPDFEQYYADPYTYFSRDLSGVYDRKLNTAKEKPFMHIVSPTSQETIRTVAATIRAKVLNHRVEKVAYLVGDSTVEHEMALNDKGFYAAEWQPSAELNGKGTTLTVKTYGKDQSVMSETITVYIGIQEKVLKQFTFDHDITGVQSNGNWPETIDTQYEHSLLDSEGKLRININGLVHTDSWQELKIGLPGIAEQVNLNHVNRVSFDVWIPASAGAQNPEQASLRAAAELPPSSIKFETDTVTGWNELGKTMIGGTECITYTAKIDLTDPAELAKAEGLQLALIGSGLDYSGPIYVDNIRLLNAYTGESNDPALVDDFESYKGSNDLLRAGYSPNGDSNSISLDADHKNNGEFGLKLDYTLAGQGYTGITKNLGSRDWSKTGKLKFWLEPDGSGKKLVIQIKANDISFEYYPSLEDATPGWVEIPFKDFTIAPWDSGNQGKKLDTVNAKKVQAFSLYVNALNNDSYTKDNPFNSTLYIDNIHVIPGVAGDIPIGDESGGDPGNGEGISPGTLYGFETDTEGWIVEATQNYADAAPPTVTADVYAEGDKSLQTSFKLEGTSFELTKYDNLDLSGLQSFNAKVKLSAGSAHVYLYVKTGNGWAWHDSGVTLVDSSSYGFTTLSIDLSQVAHPDQIKSMGFKIEPIPGTAGTAILYVDDISLS